MRRSLVTTVLDLIGIACLAAFAYIVFGVAGMLLVLGAAALLISRRLA